MGRRRAVLVGIAAAVTATLLAGCTSSGNTGSGNQGSGDKPGSAKSAPTPGGVLVEQTIDTPHDSGESYGGTLTVIVRSVVASEGRTVVSWALRWDDPQAADDASAPLGDLVAVEPPTLIDGTALKYYYPLCASDYRTAVGNQDCGYYARYYPRTLTSTQPDLINHQAMEGWAVFPELGKDTAAVDLALYGGLPAFSELPVVRP